MDSLGKTQDGKIAFGGGSVTRVGDQEMGFKCGRLLRDPGGITCTCMQLHLVSDG